MPSKVWFTWSGWMIIANLHAVINWCPELNYPTTEWLLRKYIVVPVGHSIDGMQNVTLKSATRLEQDQEFEIAKMLQEVTKSKNIKIKPVVDEELIGGFVVEWDDNQVDLSIKGHLDRIENELMTAAGAV